MKRVYGNCCGIDVHKKMIVACFIHGKKQEIREFGTTTKELTSLISALIFGFGIQTITNCSSPAAAAGSPEHTLPIRIYPSALKLTG